MNSTKHPHAFVGTSGKFYILRNEGLEIEGMTKYTSYSSVDEYNNRTGHPDFVAVAEAMQDFDHEVKVDRQAMKVIK